MCLKMRINNELDVEELERKQEMREKWLANDIRSTNYNKYPIKFMTVWKEEG